MLPFRSGCPGNRALFTASIPLVLLASTLLAQSSSSPTPKPANTFGSGGVPLPIGHMAKGLVLPDYDREGRLRARFEAATARRVDEERIEFTGLKMTTYNLETAAPDLAIDMPSSTLNIVSRVITSTERTTVRREDFSIAGDTMEFDTGARQGKLVGNVRMVITGSSPLTGTAGE
jgi:hypothetical protein